MSCYEWEHGTIKLPSAETARVKTAVRDAVNTHFDNVLRLSKECYAVVKAAGKKGAADALKKWGYTKVYGRFSDFDWSGPEGTFKSMGIAHDDARQIVSSVCHVDYWGGQREPIKFRTPTVADVEKHIGKRATNRTTAFQVGYEALISFRGNEVTWDVPENNHARNAAHAHHVAQAFFTALSRVRWTRGSGGVITGNDEYSRDSYDEGGGGNYVTMQFGPDAPRRPSGASLLYR